MNSKLSMILISILLFSLIIQSSQLRQTKESLNQQQSVFQNKYFSNSSALTSFDIENIDLKNQGSLYFSFVENNSVFYNEFSLVQLKNMNQLHQNEFFKLNITTAYINSSNPLTASQYFSKLNKNLFILYYEMGSYIILIDRFTNKILNAKYIPLVYNTINNKIVSLSNSNNLYIEMSNVSSFFMLQVDLSTNMFSTKFQSNINNNYAVFDVDLYNNTFYIVYNQLKWYGANKDYNSTIYIFSEKNSTLNVNEIDNIDLGAYVYSISVTDTSIYLYSQFNLYSTGNMISVYDTKYHSFTSSMNIGINRNLTTIRAFTDNEFLVQDEFGYAYIFYRNTYGSLAYNNINFLLKNSDGSYNDGYQIGAINLNNTNFYFMSGYINNGSKNIGFGIVFENENIEPSMFIDPNATLKLDIFGLTSTDTTSFYSSTALQSSLSQIQIVTLVIILVISIAIIILFITEHKKPLVNKRKLSSLVTQGSVSTTLNDQCSFCGSRFNELDKYCQNCGKKLR